MTRGDVLVPLNVEATSCASSNDIVKYSGDLNWNQIVTEGECTGRGNKFSRARPLCVDLLRLLIIVQLLRT